MSRRLNSPPPCASQLKLIQQHLLSFLLFAFSIIVFWCAYLIKHLNELFKLTFITWTLKIKPPRGAHLHITTLGDITATAHWMERHQNHQKVCPLALSSQSKVHPNLINPVFNHYIVHPICLLLTDIMNWCKHPANIHRNPSVKFSLEYNLQSQFLPAHCSSNQDSAVHGAPWSL